MPWSSRRAFELLEALAFAALVAWYIWRMQTVALWTWSLLLLWVFVSFLLHRDTPKTIGWRADNLWPATVALRKHSEAGWIGARFTIRLPGCVDSGHRWLPVSSAPPHQARRSATNASGDMPTRMSPGTSF